MFFRPALVFLLLSLAGTIVAQPDSASLVQRVVSIDRMLEGDFPLARTLSVRLVKESDSTSCLTCKAQAMYLLGKAFWMNGQYDSSVYLLKKSIPIAKAAGDLKTFARITNTIGNNFYYQAYYDTAIVYFLQAYHTYELLKDNVGMAATLGDISLMYHRQGNYQKTVEYLIKGEEVNDELLDNPRQMVDFPGMGNLFSDSLYFREEISDNLRALEVQTNNGDEDAMLRINLNLGRAHHQLGNYALAARYYVTGLLLQEKLGMQPLWDYAAMNFRDANMKDSCFHYHRKAMRGFHKTTRLDVLYTYELLADAHFHFGQYDSALYNYKIAMKMNSECNNRITVAGIHWRMAETLTQLERFAEAEVHIEEGMALAREVSVKHRVNLLKTATALYTKKGDYQKALEYQEHYINVTDSLSQMETAVNLSRILVQFQTSKKERELEGMKIQNESRNITMMSLGGVTLVSFAFIVVFAVQRNRIRKKNMALDRANKEQQALIGEIHHRVKNNLQIISSLINLKAMKASPETSEVLYQLNGRIYSMGLIHERLYKKNEFQLIAMDTYLPELSRYILDSFEEANKGVNLKVDCEALQIEVDSALTCGLIVNELLTNALKYAFTARQAYREVRLEMKALSEGFILLVADNGEQTSALPENFSGTYGLRFVDQLIKSKLKGTWTIDAKAGFCVLITIPNQRAAAVSN